MNKVLDKVKRPIQLRMYSSLFPILQKKYKNTPFRLLDVGCGAYSAALYKKLFPSIEYHGVDFQNPELTEAGKAYMEKYYEINLDNLDYGVIPNEYFDCIVLSHVLEHLKDPYSVVNAMLPKLKPESLAFIEYPSVKSIDLPSVKKYSFIKGTLNFYDDPTHITLVDSPKLVKLMESAGYTTYYSKIRRSKTFMLLSIFIIPWRAIKNRLKVKASDLYDFTGFAHLAYFSRSSSK